MLRLRRLPLLHLPLRLLPLLRDALALVPLLWSPMLLMVDLWRMLLAFRVVALRFRASSPLRRLPTPCSSCPALAASPASPPPGLPLARLLLEGLCWGAACVGARVHCWTRAPPPCLPPRLPCLQQRPWTPPCACVSACPMSRSHARPSARRCPLL